MPIQYERIDRQRRIVAVAQGIVTLEETLSLVARQASEGAWSYGLLYDARADINIPSADDIHCLVQQVGALTTKYGPRGRVALVMRDPELFKMGLRYARLGNLTSLAVGLFMTIDDAERWLADE